MFYRNRYTCSKRCSKKFFCGFLSLIIINPVSLYHYIKALVSVLQCTAPMSQIIPQPPPQQAPHPVPQQLPHPCPQPVTQPQRQEMFSSTETLGQPGEVAPNPLPFPANTLRSCSPKPDASEVYLKSKAMLDSKRKCV